MQGKLHRGHVEQAVRGASQCRRIGPLRKVRGAFPDFRRVVFHFRLAQIH